MNIPKVGFNELSKENKYEIRLSNIEIVGELGIQIQRYFKSPQQLKEFVGLLQAEANYYKGNIERCRELDHYVYTTYVIKNENNDIIWYLKIFDI